MGTYIDLSNAHKINDDILEGYTCIYDMDQYNKDYCENLDAGKELSLKTVFENYINNLDLVIGVFE